MLTQLGFAERLGLSPSYLNQIENNQRPLTASVLLALAQTFSVNLNDFTFEESDRLIGDLKEVLADPVFSGLTPNKQDLKTIAMNSPWLAHALLDLHGAYRRAMERSHVLDEAFKLHRVDSNDTDLSLPYEEVRDFVHYRGNYFDDLDKAAEATVMLNGLWRNQSINILENYIKERHHINVRFEELDSKDYLVRKYDPHLKQLTLRSGLGTADADFQIAYQIGQLEQAQAIDKIVRDARFRSRSAEEIARLALGNYCAAALMLPYGQILETTRKFRYDIERLARHFRCSLEQICHRLSTLQRPGARGIPIYFVRVDRAGNILKRHSATRFQFARFGGACPLWNVHESFDSPGKFLTQIAEMPDGARYLCVATSVVKSGGDFRTPLRHIGLGIGCEWSFAGDLVYADGLDPKSAPSSRIGISCRICERNDCAQRAAPPVDRTLKVDRHVRNYVPYSF